MQNLGEGTSATTMAVMATSTTTTTAALTTTVIVSGADSTFAPPLSRGIDIEDAESWMTGFEKYSTYRDFSEQERLRLLVVLLQDEAPYWYDSLEAAIRASWAVLKDAFEQRFQHSELLRYRKANDLWQRVHGVGENVDSYVTAVKKLAKATDVQGEQLCYAVQRGLHPQILAHVIQAQTTTVDDLLTVELRAASSARSLPWIPV